MGLDNERINNHYFDPIERICETTCQTKLVVHIGSDKEVTVSGVTVVIAAYKPKKSDQPKRVDNTSRQQTLQRVDDISCQKPPKNQLTTQTVNKF